MLNTFSVHAIARKCTVIDYRCEYTFQKYLPGVGGVDPREFEDLELSKLSMFEEELVLLPCRE